MVSVGRVNFLSGKNLVLWKLDVVNMLQIDQERMKKWAGERDEMVRR
ncbi:hypothetical protein ABMB67_004329 [Halalkalibacter oceani]